MRRYIAGLLIAAITIPMLAGTTATAYAQTEEGAAAVTDIVIDETTADTREGDLDDTLDTGMEQYTRSKRYESNYAATGQLTIVLDPGHDDTHQGANHNGVKEADLNLKIAKYCKAELEQYKGVTVYMTRETTACPYPGSSSADDNHYRTAFASQVGADVYISIHCNSSTSGREHGAEVYYPNRSYNAAISEEGRGLSGSILNYLSFMGISSRGIMTRDSEDHNTYPDGSPADYYGVIRTSKLYGIPGIIVEHAYVSNQSDVSHYLNTENKLIELGKADAEGIVAYYGLEKGDGYTFDAKYYYDKYPDLQAAIGYNPEALLAHFQTCGLKEGREASPVFNINYYMSHNADLRAAYGNDYLKYCEHFRNTGTVEGRQGNETFNVISYKNRYADLRNLYGDNLKQYYRHYVNAGYKEGREATGYENEVIGEPVAPEGQAYMYRLYNPNSGEHFYTASTKEKYNLITVGWKYEGIGWTAPIQGYPVYRMYNANAGDHHYTMSTVERDTLIQHGWKYEDIAFYSAVDEQVPLYRSYNPNAKAGAHNYTTNTTEYTNLGSLGWSNEGIAWYGVN